MANGADREAVTILATALDKLGARFHRDLHPESSYLDTEDPTAMRKAIDDFAAYVEERLAALDHPAVKRALTEAKAAPTCTEFCRCPPGACDTDDPNACDGCAICLYGCPNEHCDDPAHAVAG